VHFAHLPQSLLFEAVEDSACKPVWYGLLLHALLGFPPSHFPASGQPSVLHSLNIQSIQSHDGASNPWDSADEDFPVAAYFLVPTIPMTVP